MRISLINARNSDSGVMPFGLLSIAAVLERANHQVQLFDPFFGNMRFLKEVSDFKPDLIGLSFLTASYQRAKQIRQEIKRMGMGAKVCSGGIHTTALPEETLKDMDLDFIVFGEGEATVLETVERIEDGRDLEGVAGLMFRDGSEVIRNHSRDLIPGLDSLPDPAWHLLPVEKYLIPPGYIRSAFFRRTLVLFTDRGCPYHCTFCATHSMFGRKVRWTSVSRSLEQFDYLAKWKSVGFVLELVWTFVRNIFKLKPYLLKSIHARKPEDLVDFVLYYYRLEKMRWKVEY